MMRNLVVTAGLVFTAAVLAAPRPAPAQALPSDKGGVLLLHVVSQSAFVPDTADVCASLPVVRYDEVQTRMPADGVTRLVVVYAAFPKDSMAAIAGVTFGLQYSGLVKVVDKGPCRTVNYQIPEEGWPRSGSGAVVTLFPPQMTAPGVMLPIYWFAVSAAGPSFMELTPDPKLDPRLVMGGRFGTVDNPPRMEPITGFGRVGFGLEGSVPPTGGAQVFSGCCLGNCYLLSQVECDALHGIYLGDGTKCDNLPCGSDAIKGGCCLPGGCEMQTLLDCARLGGVSLGEGVACGTRPCPGTRSPSDRSAVSPGDARESGEPADTTRGGRDATAPRREPARRDPG